MKWSRQKKTADNAPPGSYLVEWHCPAAWRLPGRCAPDAWPGLIQYHIDLGLARAGEPTGRRLVTAWVSREIFADCQFDFQRQLELGEPDFEGRRLQTSRGQKFSILDALSKAGSLIVTWAAVIGAGSAIYVFQASLFSAPEVELSSPRSDVALSEGQTQTIELDAKNLSVDSSSKFVLTRKQTLPGPTQDRIRITGLPTVVLLEPAGSRAIELAVSVEGSIPDDERLSFEVEGLARAGVFRRALEVGPLTIALNLYPDQDYSPEKRLIRPTSAELDHAIASLDFKYGHPLGKHDIQVHLAHEDIEALEISHEGQVLAPGNTGDRLEKVYLIPMGEVAENSASRVILAFRDRNNASQDVAFWQRVLDNLKVVNFRESH